MFSDISLSSVQTVWSLQAVISKVIKMKRIKIYLCTMLLLFFLVSGFSLSSSHPVFFTQNPQIPLLPFLFAFFLFFEFTFSLSSFFSHSFSLLFSSSSIFWALTSLCVPSRLSVQHFCSKQYQKHPLSLF